MQRLVALFASCAALVGFAVVLPASAGAATTSQPGAYVPVTPFRAANSVTGGNGNLHGALRAHTATRVIVGGLGGVPTSNIAALAVTITAEQGTAGGALVAYQDGTSAPSTANVQFARGQRVSDFAVVPSTTNGRIDIYNRASGTVQLLVDVQGYYLAGTATAKGALHRMLGTGAAQRIVDTRSQGGAVAAHAARTFSLGGHGLPTSGVRAVAATFNVIAPARPGTLTAYQAGTERPGIPTFRFIGATSSAGAAVVPVSDGVQLTVYNATAAPLNFTIDVSAYFIDGVANTSNTFQPLPPRRALDTRSQGGAIPASGTRVLRLGGVVGVPLARPASVLVALSSVDPASSGAIEAWAGGTRPAVANVLFGTGQSESDVALVPLSSTGSISIYNASGRPLNVLVDVLGYVLGSSLTVPAVSNARYVRNVTQTGADDTTTMSNEGCADAQAGSTYVLLELGTQSITAPLSADDPGVLLTGTHDDRIDYPRIVQLVTAYLGGFRECASDLAATVAIGTNSDGVYHDALNAYLGGYRGRDWANDVVDPLRTAAPAGLNVVAADDIEASFAGTYADVRAWETEYYAATHAPLVYNGSLDGCSSDYGLVSAPCGVQNWTFADYVALTTHNGQVSVLPQIYVPEQARQWANLRKVAGSSLIFAGVLTEHAADPAGSYTPSDGWAALDLALSWIVTTPSLPVSVDLQVDA